jgi:threonine dehydrogenase-like Zn-dependent dehydrogenase
MTPAYVGICGSGKHPFPRVEPLAVAWHAVNISPFKFGHNVLVMGGGPNGIGIVQVLKVHGAKEIMVVEPTESRRRLSKDFGATHLLNPHNVDVPETVLSTDR